MSGRSLQRQRLSKVPVRKSYLSQVIYRLLPCLRSSAPDFGNFIMSSNHRNNLKNTNIEMRNTKQYRNANFQNSKQKHNDTTVFRFGHWYFGHLYLFRVSMFEFRISPSPTDGWNVWICMNISCCHFKALSFWDGTLCRTSFSPVAAAGWNGIACTNRLWYF